MHYKITLSLTVGFSPPTLYIYLSVKFSYKDLCVHLNVSYPDLVSVNLYQYIPISFTIDYTNC